MLLNNFKETEISPVTDYTTNNAVQQLFSTVNRKIAQDNPFYSTHLDAGSSIFWLSLNPDCPAKFTPELVSALREAKLWLRGLMNKEVSALCDEHKLQPPSTVDRGEPGRLTAPPEAEHPFEHPYYWSAFILIGDPG